MEFKITEKYLAISLVATLLQITLLFVLPQNNSSLRYFSGLFLAVVVIVSAITSLVKREAELGPVFVLAYEWLFIYTAVMGGA